MEAKEMQAAIEAILFVTGEPVTVSDLARALETTPEDMDNVLENMENDMRQERRGLMLKRFGQHVQLTTRAELAPFVERLLQPVQKQSLSQSALETLAVIAYRQPVTKLDIEAVRGVKCDYSVQSLLNKGLITDLGRKEVVGRPILYGTTDAFLSHFGLRSLDELPAPPTPEGEPEQQKMDLDEPPMVP